MAAYRDEDEEQILERVRASNQAAFELLFKRYRTGLVKYCMARLQNTEDTDDVIGSAMIGLWTMRVTYKSVEHFKASAYRITNQRILDCFRRRNRSKGQSDGREAGAEDPHIGAILERDRLHCILTQIKQMLDERQLRIFKYHTLVGLTITETALKIGETRDKVKWAIANQIARAIEQAGKHCDK